MLPWALTDSGAKNIYNAMCKWYNSPNNLPNHVGDKGVFKGYANFTRDKLWFCIETLKKNYGLGWFTDDYAARNAALESIATALYNTFGGAVEFSGIKTFLAWVYNFAKNDVDAVKYFSGGDYSLLDNISKTVQTSIVEPVKEVAQDINYAISYPSLKSLLPDNLTLLKWGLIIGGGLYVWKFLENRTKRI